MVEQISPATASDPAVTQMIARGPRGPAGLYPYPSYDPVDAPFDKHSVVANLNSLWLALRNTSAAPTADNPDDWQLWIDGQSIASDSAIAVQAKEDAVAAAVAAAADAVATAADRVATGADATATAADRVQTGLDRTATAADRVQTGLDVDAVEGNTQAVATLASQVTIDAAQVAGDRVQTGLDRTATGADATATAADAIATAADRVQTGLDRVQTDLDRTATGADAVATAADRVQTGLDRTATGADATATAADAVATAADAVATAADRVQTGLDAATATTKAAAASASAIAAALNGGEIVSLTGTTRGGVGRYETINKAGQTIFSVPADIVSSQTPETSLSHFTCRTAFGTIIHNQLTVDNTTSALIEGYTPVYNGIGWIRSPIQMSDATKVMARFSLDRRLAPQDCIRVEFDTTLGLKTPSSWASNLLIIHIDGHSDANASPDGAASNRVAMGYLSTNQLRITWGTLATIDPVGEVNNAGPSCHILGWDDAALKLRAWRNNTKKDDRSLTRAVNGDRRVVFGGLSTGASATGVHEGQLNCGLLFNTAGDDGSDIMNMIKAFTAERAGLGWSASGA